MSRIIQCKKYDKPLEGLTKAPYPGDLGQKLYDEISQQAWSDWLKRQTMFINEYRLTMTEKKDRDFLRAEMQKFLFEKQDNKPEGFTEHES